MTRLKRIFNGRQVTGRFLATTSVVLERMAQRLGKRRLINLTGGGPAVSTAASIASG